MDSGLGEVIGFIFGAILIVLWLLWMLTLPNQFREWFNKKKGQ